MPEAAKMAVIRRRRKQTDQMDLGIEISHARRFSFRIPDDIPYDNEDAERIIERLEAMPRPPKEILGPVPSGVGDLVSDGYDLIFWDDPREDIEIMLEIEDAVKAGLIDRNFRVPAVDAR